jgi:hypothetical protein
MFVEDFSPFFQDFAADAVLAGQSVRVIFDNTAANFDGLVAGTNPVALIESSVSVSRGQSLVIGTATYKVVGIAPDGAGISRLDLEAQ